MKASKLFSILASLVVLSIMGSCEDSYSEYTKKYIVNFNYAIASSQQLFTTIGNYGQYCNIRRETSNGKTEIVMSNSSGTGRYTITSTEQYFSYGLGGLIVGTTSFGENVAYDLACPNCDRASRRLTLMEAGYASCNHCGVTYDMNNHGVISATDSTVTYSDLRGLYRYRITVSGNHLAVYN